MKENIEYEIEKEISSPKETVKGKFCRELNVGCILVVCVILFIVLSILIGIAYFKKIEGGYCNVFAILICAISLVAIFVCITIIFIASKKYECKTREMLEQGNSSDWLLLKAYENLLSSKKDKAEGQEAKKS